MEYLTLVVYSVQLTWYDSPGGGEGCYILVIGRHLRTARFLTSRHVGICVCVWVCV